MAITIDGTGSISGLSATGISAQPVFPGNILQVVSTTKTDTFSSVVNTTWTDITGLSASITPSSVSSKVLVFTSIQGVLFRTTENAILFRLMRDSSAISVGDAAGSRSRVSLGGAKVGNDSIVGASINFLDAPATTSSTTYKIQFWQDTITNPFFLNRTVNDNDSVAIARCVSVITLMEVAA